MTRIRALLALFIVFALAAAACGGGDDPILDPDETTPVDEPEEETLEAADEDDDEPTPTPTPTEPIQPLTGLPLDDPSIMERPALMVKIDNSPDARPQEGLNEADQVIELLVEGITRLAFVFHSTDTDPVGPIRSGRSSDPDLAGNYNRPLFAWSGGNATVRGEVRQGEVDGKLYDIGVDQSPPDYYRAGSPRFAPHNLMSTTEALYALSPDENEPPLQIFDYRGEDGDLPSDADEVPGIEITWRGGLQVHYVWNDDLGGWSRFQRDTPHVDAEGVQATPPNVVLFTTPYGASAATSLSPQALTVGSGEAFVLTDGMGIDGAWSREDALEPWDLLGLDDEPIGLTPGQTFIGLVEPGNVRILTQAEADELLEQVV
ncbi:MAG: DUF3048 domain-containing protein [Acidimicrobiia bacterium]|nr:DUF3048 domain-containing protein [Acidimicrobiia bacterium]